MDNEELVGLIARCALEDQQALAILYQKTASYLNAIAYRIVRSEDLSNEVLQDAFVQIWNNAGAYMSSQTRPMTWMGSIVRYRAIDKLRAESKHAVNSKTDNEDDPLDKVAGGENPDETFETITLSNELERCLNSLNDNFRTSIKLAYFYGYSREELVGILGTNINTVKSWLHRGSQKLKDCLQNSGDNHEKI